MLSLLLIVPIGLRPGGFCPTSACDNETGTDSEIGTGSEPQMELWRKLWKNLENNGRKWKIILTFATCSISPFQRHTQGLSGRPKRLKRTGKRKGIPEKKSSARRKDGIRRQILHKTSN